jgi:hypothetical protein
VAFGLAGSGAATTTKRAFLLSLAGALEGREYRRSSRCGWQWQLRLKGPRQRDVAARGRNRRRECQQQTFQTSQEYQLALFLLNSPPVFPHGGQIPSWRCYRPKIFDNQKT